jgi:carbonic anhydrase/acetyltransferase-like protein (isoleucine patch superfamily)
MSMPPEEIERLKKHFPHRYNPTVISPSAWVAPGAQVLGDVVIGEESSVWFNAVLRGDVNYIRVGKRTNIQDLTMVHVSYESYPTIIGDGVTIGHSAVIHACTIGNHVLIGMGSVILDGAEIGDDVIIGAGSLVTGKTKIPSGSKAFGRPAKVIATLTESEREFLRWSENHYVNLAKTYRK